MSVLFVQIGEYSANLKMMTMVVSTEINSRPLAVLLALYLQLKVLDCYSNKKPTTTILVEKVIGVVYNHKYRIYDRCTSTHFPLETVI